MRAFDYIIVGGGSAGAALAGRLSEEENLSILLLEAGPHGRHPWIRIPIGYGKVFFDSRFNWKYQTEPDPNLDDREIYWPRGKVLGGSSAINAMCWVRGHAYDFDTWAKTAPGWGWDEVAPIFRRIEDWLGPPDPLRGHGGPVAVSDVSPHMHALSRIYLQAAAEAGIPTNLDYNAARMDGAGFYQITTKDGYRASTADSYLRPARKRLNLRVVTGALATKILFRKRKAIGVDYRLGGMQLSAKARREVILCGGAINSPQLLQLSGIGPGGHLQELGIAPLLDSPEVGRNLQDHLGYDHVYQSTIPSLNQVLRPFWGKAKVALQYLLSRTGPLSMSLNHGGGFVRVCEGGGPPDLQLYFSPLSYTRAPAGKRPLMNPDPFPAFRLGFNPCRPTSMGHLKIRSSNPCEPPQMHGNYLATEHDRQLMIAGVKLMRKIAATPALSAVIAKEMSPGQQITQDADILKHVRGDSGTVFHQCGTCRMGQDAAVSVVDARLRVHGIEGLRVADASIFPTIPTGNTNAPAVMVGEKAADMIREDHKAGKGAG